MTSLSTKLKELDRVESIAETIDAPLVVYRRMSEVQAKPITWLWPERIARGKVAIIAGNPGLGKSQFTCSLAAITTTGGAWPVDKTVCETGSAIFLSAEDDAGDTIRPRLEAAGANLDRVYILDAIKQINNNQITERSFNLSLDLPRLDTMMETIGNVTLVVIDPITAYLGDTDSHKTAEVRALLAPLQRLAEKHRSAFVCVSHFNKSSMGDPMARVTGSFAFVQAARAAHVICRDKDDPHKRLFLPMKNNLASDDTGLSFTIESCQIGAGIDTSRVRWLPDVITVSAAEALAVSMDPQDMGERGEARAWLVDALSDGPKAVDDLEKEAKAAGHSWRTVKRAKSDLKAVSAKDSFSGGWYWSLPKRAKSTNDSPIHKNLAPFGEVGPLREFPEEKATSRNPQEGQFTEESQGGQLYKGKTCPACDGSGCRWCRK